MQAETGVCPQSPFLQFISSLFASRNHLFAWFSQGMFNHKLSNGNAAAIAGTVDILLLADQERNTAIHPVREYLVATQQSGPLVLRGEISRSVVSCGIEGLVTDLPAGFEHRHILVAGAGVHNTFENWGRALLKRSGKPVPSKYADDVMEVFRLHGRLRLLLSGARL